MRISKKRQETPSSFKRTSLCRNLVWQALQPTPNRSCCGAPWVQVTDIDYRIQICCFRYHSLEHTIHLSFRENGIKSCLVRDNMRVPVWLSEANAGTDIIGATSPIRRCSRRFATETHSFKTIAITALSSEIVESERITAKKWPTFALHVAKTVPDWETSKEETKMATGIISANWSIANERWKEKDAFPL